MQADRLQQKSLYEFGLSPAQETHARRLHADSIVFDLLSQGAGSNIFDYYPSELRAELDAQMARAGLGFEAFVEALYWPFEMSRLGKSDLIADWLRLSGLTCGTYGVGVHDGRDPTWLKWEQHSLRYADLPWARYVTRAEEIRQAKRDGVIAFYGHCQPMIPVPRDLNALDAAYARGLRSFMLTYNLMDTVGVGCTERVDAGLSRFGIDVVKHCNEIGVIVDVSHCGQLTTLEACRHSKKPVTANHTAAKGIFSHARGKADDALRAIADTDGVVGVVALPAFLTADSEPTIDQMLDHMDYIASLVGWQHVAIGTDWPLQAPEAIQRAVLAPASKDVGFRKEDQLDVTMRLRGFDDSRDLINITRGLVKRGYRDPEIRGILGENALRVFAAVCG